MKYSHPFPLPSSLLSSFMRSISRRLKKGVREEGRERGGQRGPRFHVWKSWASLFVGVAIIATVGGWPEVNVDLMAATASL